MVLKHFFRKFNKKKPDKIKYKLDLSQYNLNSTQITQLNNSKINLRSKINDLNIQHGTKGIMGDRLSDTQIDDIVKKLSEKKLKNLETNNQNSSLQINQTDLNDIIKEFKYKKWRNKKQKYMKAAEWSFKITIAGVGIWRASIALAELENSEKILKEINSQKVANDDQIKKIKDDDENKNSEKILDLENENKELERLKDQHDIISYAVKYLSDDEYKFFMSLPLEQRIEYLIDLGMISVNEDGSLILNKKSNVLLYIIIGVTILILLLILYFILKPKKIDNYLEKY